MSIGDGLLSTAVSVQGERKKAERHEVWERENQEGEVSVLCVSVMYQKSALLFMFSASMTSQGVVESYTAVSAFSPPIDLGQPAATNSQLHVIQSLSIYHYMHIFVMLI